MKKTKKRNLLCSIVCAPFSDMDATQKKTNMEGARSSSNDKQRRQRETKTTTAQTKQTNMHNNVNVSDNISEDDNGSTESLAIVCRKSAEDVLNCLISKHMFGAAEPAATRKGIDPS